MTNRELEIVLGQTLTSTAAVRELDTKTLAEITLKLISITDSVF